MTDTPAFDCIAPTTRLFRAPGRVNLIGEHTDYNGGFVLPVALDLATIVAIKPRRDRTVKVHTSLENASCVFDLDDPAPTPRHDWTDYVRGVALVLEREGYRLCGAELEIDSTVPLGAGLSSSAALEVSVACALADVAGHVIPRLRLAQLCQMAENGFVGMRCGIMDQFIACCGQAGHALMIDCRSLEARALPIKSEVRIVICNSMVRHQLASSEYNVSRQECERGVVLLQAALGAITSLRDVSVAALEAHKALLPDVVYRRCHHVVTENARVLAAADALVGGDMAAFGRLMAESHVSMRDDFEISCPEIECLVALAQAQPGVFGSRMTGGGFGGCTVGLVAAAAVDNFSAAVTAGYAAATGRTPQIFTCVSGAGAGPLS